MNHPDYPYLFSPIRIGNFEVPNRVCHVPTDISSANADGSVNERVITYHEQVAKGGCGFIIVGASTPHKATGRPTVTCIAVDEDPLIPGLAELAEAMHRHGARCAVQIQHPGRQAAWRFRTMSRPPAAPAVCFLQFLDDDVLVGENADVAGDL